MGGKLEGGGGRKDRVDGDADTRSYRQSSGNIDKDVENQRLSRMPHERDESATATGNRLEEDPSPSDTQISHAVDDLNEGQVDTDRRGVPNDVPAPKRGRKR